MSFQKICCTARTLRRIPLHRVLGRDAAKVGLQDRRVLRDVERVAVRAGALVAMKRQRSGIF